MSGSHAERTAFINAYYDVVIEFGGNIADINKQRARVLDSVAYYEASPVLVTDDNYTIFMMAKDKYESGIVERQLLNFKEP